MFAIEKHRVTLRTEPQIADVLAPIDHAGSRRVGDEHRLRLRVGPGRNLDWREREPDRGDAGRHIVGVTAKGPDPQARRSSS